MVLVCGRISIRKKEPRLLLLSLALSVQGGILDLLQGPELNAHGLRQPAMIFATCPSLKAGIPKASQSSAEAAVRNNNCALGLQSREINS